MVKAIFLIRRKPDLTREQFQEHYEGRHVGLALEYIRPFIKGYHRNYPGSSSSYFDTVENNSGAAGRDFDYDCVTEMWFESEEHLNGMLDRLSEPEVRSVIAQDEARFIDPQSVVFLKCEERRAAL